jgi:hypothetical protein
MVSGTVAGIRDLVFNKQLGVGTRPIEAQTSHSKPTWNPLPAGHLSQNPFFNLMFGSLLLFQY